MFISCDKSYKHFLFRGIDENGKEIRKKVPFKASLFIESKEPSEFRGLKSEKVLKKFDFSSSTDFFDFKKKFEGKVYGDISPELQHLASIEIDKKLSLKIRSWIIDIEVYAKGEFPTPDKAHKFPIVSLTLNDPIGDIAYTFVYDIYDRCTLKSTVDWKIMIFNDEKEMLNTFLKFFRKNLQNIHIISGWNSEIYDLPYLIKRITHLFGEEEINRLSPFNNVNLTGKFKDEYRIVGLPHLDYMKLFKKFNIVARSSYSLENIAQEELGYGKMDHSEYNSYAEFYEKNINKYVEYNLLDTNLVKGLNNKFNYFGLAVTIAMLSRINIENVFSPIRCWESLIYCRLLQRNIIIDPRKRNHKEEYMGAFVKEPKDGLIRDIISYDLNSLYPSVIMAMNLSPETICEHMHDDQASIDNFLNGYKPEAFHNEHMIVDPSGSVFTKEIKGILPELMGELFNERKKYQKIKKDKIAELKKLKESIK